MSFQDPAQTPGSPEPRPVAGTPGSPAGGTISSPAGGTIGSPAGYALPVSPLPSPTISPLIAERRRTSALSLLLGFALVVAVGGVAFAAGRLTAPATTAATGGRGGNGTGTFGGGTGFGPGASGAPGTGTGGNRFGAGGLGTGAGVSIRGTVQSVSATSLTLALPSGTTIDIPLDASTTYHGQTAATAADVKTGTQVVVELASGFGGRGGGAGGAGTGGTGTGGAPAPVGSPGTAPSPGTAASPGASGGVRTGQARAVGPARDVTVIAP